MCSSSLQLRIKVINFKDSEVIQVPTPQIPCCLLRLLGLAEVGVFHVFLSSPPGSPRCYRGSLKHKECFLKVLQVVQDFVHQPYDVCLK